MQAQNVSSTVAAFCSTFFGTAKTGTVWSGFAIANWSKASFDLLNRIAFLAKDILADFSDMLKNLFPIRKKFRVAAKGKIKLAGGMEVADFLRMYWHFDESAL
jgi:hypothetical protein